MEKDTEIKTVGKEKEIKEDKQKKAAETELKKTEPKPLEQKKMEESPSKKDQGLSSFPKGKKLDQSEEKAEVKPEDKKTTETKSSLIKKKQEPKKPKKTEAVVRVDNLPISTKKALAICKFIKNKTISQAIRDLEKVSSLRKAVPVKGEYAHRRGKIMAGKYPQRAAKNFIALLKSLVANASDLQEPVIYEAIANIGSRPYGRFGQVRKKRTHVFIKALEKKKLNKKNKLKKTKARIRNSAKAVLNKGVKNV
jgi:ribosomal protein L22